jgi:group II intron reverse transcriptase/maturase
MNKYKAYSYYNMTGVCDHLYKEAKENKTFERLMPLILDENNIKLAFRMIKTNTGSETEGTDGIKISDIKRTDINEYVKEVQSRLQGLYKPGSVRRVYIEKETGGTRPLGIPTMVDRLIQQSIKQIMEPICEAKFHPHSYGFRPNRSTKHAIAYVNRLINIQTLNYCVDVDIKSFFDNVNHNKLKKQIFSLGIHDRKLIAIIGAMLKAPIEGEGIPTKGTPQGGNLSPLLANIVLNEFDWWIDSQWRTFAMRKPTQNRSSDWNKLRKTNLKEMHIVRYADDFKIFCRTYSDAVRIFEAVSKWLKNRLDLDISESKSKIVNLRKKWSEFLGIKIKAIPKKTYFGDYAAYSKMSEKSIEKVKRNIRMHVKELQKEIDGKNINSLNAVILGTQQYYKIATNVSIDFNSIAFQLTNFMKCRLKNRMQYGYPKRNDITHSFLKFYKLTRKTFSSGRLVIYPIACIKHSSQMMFSQECNDYSIEGRKIIKAKTSSREYIAAKIALLQKHYIENRSVEYNDNRLARAAMSGMKCEITRLELDIKELHCHHYVSNKQGGTDEYDNLRILHEDVHILVHATTVETIKKYMNYISSKKVLDKVNKYRKVLGLLPIIIQEYGKQALK